MSRDITLVIVGAALTRAFNENWIGNSIRFNQVA